MSRPLRLGLSLALGLVAAASIPDASANSTCGWMTTQEVTKLLPSGAPWQVMTGGAVGACKFMGRGQGQSGATIIGANQMLKASAAEAAKTAQGLRTALGESYRIEAVPALGEHGFRYLPRDASGDDSRRTTSYVGHYKHVAITGQLVLPVGGRFEDADAGATAFMRAALAIADDAKVTADVSQCPHFDDALLRKLLPGDGYSQQAYGANSCMAQNGNGGALVFSIMERASSEVVGRMRDGTCTWESPTELGDGAWLGHTCSGGRPRAELQLMVGQHLHRYALALQREPTAAERALLVEMVRAVQSR